LYDKQINSLKYLAAVLNESMRVRLPVPFVQMVAKKDTTAGGVAITAGQSVIVNLRRAAAEESNFTRAKEFWPEVCSTTNTTLVIL
jgi:cytochrome P450